MSTGGGLSLFSSAIDQSLEDADPELQKLCERVVDRLDRLPLVIDLAGARTKAEMENGRQASFAVQQYLMDFKVHRQRMLRSTDYAQSSPYGKTVWTAWETSRSTLKKTRDLLWFGLVRPTKEQWPELIMHSLAQWRASQEGDSGDCQRWYFLFFITAASQQGWKDTEASFRRHLTTHLPASVELGKEDPSLTDTDLCYTWTYTGRVWEKEG